MYTSQVIPERKCCEKKVRTNQSLFWAPQAGIKIWN